MSVAKIDNVGGDTKLLVTSYYINCATNKTANLNPNNIPLDHIKLLIAPWYAYARDENFPTGVYQAVSAYRPVTISGNTITIAPNNNWTAVGTVYVFYTPY